MVERIVVRVNHPIQGNLTLYSASIGKKAVVALTGLALFGFVLQHTVGNLQTFLGPEVYNAYAVNLKKSLGGFIWLARGGLVAIVLIHIVATMQLVTQSNAARKVGYRVEKSAVTTYGAKTMKYTGPMLACFIVFHLVHFTAPGVAMSSAYVHDHNNVYAAFVAGFRIPWVSALYLAAQVMLGLHIHHGAASLFQTLGLNHPRYNKVRQMVPQALALFVAGGNMAMPLGVMFGVIK